VALLENSHCLQPLKRTQNPEWRSRIKKDPGIPNLFPYKDKILHEIEEKKRQKEEERARLREQARAQRAGGNTAVEDAQAGAEDEEADEDDDVLLDNEMDEGDEAMEDVSCVATSLLEERLIPCAG